MGYPRGVHGFGRYLCTFVLKGLGFFALGACAGESESGRTDVCSAMGSSWGGIGGTAGEPLCGDAQAGAVGVLCVRGTLDGENERIDVGDPLRIDVRQSGCHSSSCTEVVVETCSITGTGPDFTASAAFCLASTADPNVSCTADCGGGGYARCESDERLEAGHYTVTLGDLSVSFTVPGMLSLGAACDGSQF